jgi:hypothetical protein
VEAPTGEANFFNTLGKSSKWQSGKTERDVFYLSKLLFADILQCWRWQNLLGILVE